MTTKVVHLYKRLLENFGRESTFHGDIRSNKVYMCIYKDGNFMQVLEGEESAVRGLHAKISNDPRHRGLITLLHGNQEERQFPNWSMGFRDLAAPEVQSLPGYNEFLNTALTGEEFSDDPTRCQKLLLSFKQNM